MACLGGQIERMVIQTDWDNDEAVAYLQRRLDRMSLEVQLAKRLVQLAAMRFAF